MKSKEITFSVAPMMDWTDRHCRVFHRMLSARARLFTEMVVADAVIHGERAYLLGYHEQEHPVALQIGGSDPQKLAQAAKIGSDFGYDEINLNVGCPSDRVQSGRFGACLMADPNLVAQCFSDMQALSNAPVTIKCRIGIDEQDPQQTLPDFIETVKQAGCKTFIIHARKAWLDGLSPKENRTVPPLDYKLVRDIKRAFPELSIVLNGGLEDFAQTQKAAHGLDGVMFGRAAYHRPWILSEVDATFYNKPPHYKNRDDIVAALLEYVREVEMSQPSVKAITRHIMGLYHGQPAARIWRQALSAPWQGENVSHRIERAFLALNQARETHKWTA